MSLKQACFSGMNMFIQVMMVLASICGVMRVNAGGPQKGHVPVGDGT
jgi:hypothetical protein